MYIGEAAEKSGASIKAIRLYEQLGLLTPIARHNNYRVFDEEHVLLIKFIKIAQSFDIKLGELKTIISSDDDSVNWETIRDAISEKKQKIDHEIARLESQKKSLKHYDDAIKQCLSDFTDCSFPHVKK